MISYFEKRPNILPLIMVVLFITFVFGYPLYQSENPSDFIQRNAASIFLGIIVLLIPVFVLATRATLVSDLSDERLAPKLEAQVSDFSNYDTHPLKMTVARLFLAKADQRSSSMKNLALGVGFSVVSITLVVQLAASSSSSLVLALPNEEFLVKHIGPKAGAVIFIQVVATFFFRLYARNLREIVILTDKLTFIETKIAALQLSDLHADDVRKWLLSFDLEMALTSQRVHPRSLGFPQKAVDKVNVSIGK